MLCAVVDHCLDVKQLIFEDIDGRFSAAVSEGHWIDSVTCAQRKARRYPGGESAAARQVELDPYSHNSSAYCRWG